MLVGIDVYNRHQHAVVSGERLLAALPGARIVLFSNGGRVRELDPAIEQVDCAENSGQHDGCRDAGNAFLPFLSADDAEPVVRLHADSHPVSVDALRALVARIRPGLIVSVRPQPGIRVLGDGRVECMHDGRRPAGYVNCHLWGCAAGDYRRLFPMDFSTQVRDLGVPASGIGIECAIGETARLLGIPIAWDDVELATENDYGHAMRRLGRA